MAFAGRKKTIRALAAARTYSTRIALAALLANSTITCSDDPVRLPSSAAGRAGSAGKAGLGGEEAGFGGEAGAPEPGGTAGTPNGGHNGLLPTGGSAGNDASGGSSGNGASSGNAAGTAGINAGGTSGAGSGGGGASNAGTSGGGASNAGTSGAGMSGAGTGGGGEGGAGTAGGGASNAGTSGAGMSGAGAGGGGTSGAGTGGGGTSNGGASGGGASNAGTGGASAGAGGGSTCPSATCTTPWSTENCGGDCGPITSAACLACEGSACNDVFCSTLGNVLADEGSATGQPRLSLCNQALACLRQTGCSLSAESPEAIVAACYCGTTAWGQCTAQTANGPCQKQFKEGLETGSPTVQAERITDTTYGGGTAYLRTYCDELSSCADSGCFKK